MKLRIIFFSDGLIVPNATTTGGTSRSATVTPSPSPSQSGSSDGLPEESRIVAYTVLVLAAVAIAALWWVVIRRKRKARAAVIQVTLKRESQTPFMKPELPSDNTRAELEGHRPTDGFHELE